MFKNKVLLVLTCRTVNHGLLFRRTDVMACSWYTLRWILISISERHTCNLTLLVRILTL